MTPSLSLVHDGDAPPPQSLYQIDPDHNARVSELADRYFSQNAYAELYDDVGSIYRDDQSFDLRDHFLLYGCEEGRTPSLLFDVDYVSHRLAKFDDTELPRRDIFRHFAMLPAEQRFIPNRLFSPWAFRALYTARYPEIADLSDYALFEFYLDHQAYAALSPNGVFNEAAYRTRYPDVARAVGEGSLASGFQHFLLHGQSDGRVNLPGTRGVGPACDAVWIRTGQPGLEPVLWWFNELFYLSVYPDVQDLVRRSIVMSGLEHFLLVGYAEGRLPCPQAFAQMTAKRDPDPWRHFDDPSHQCADGPASIPIEQACVILRYLEASAAAGPRASLTNALWPFVARPKLGGAFNARNYLAVNTDVANMLGGSHDAALQHWEEHGAHEHRVAPGTNLFGARSITFADMIDWKSGVNFFGPVSSASGLGSAARGYVAALREAGVPVDVYDTSWQINRKLPADLFCAADLAYSINFICLNADQVLPFTMKYGTEIFDHRANVGAWVWELSSPRPEWRSVLSAFDLIVTPSRFCTDSFSLFTSRPVRTIPYVVDAAELEAARDRAGENYWNARIEAEKRAGRKIVLFIMDASSYTERKGVDIFTKLAARVDASRPGEFLFVLKSHSRDYSLSHVNSYGDAVLVLDGVFTFPDLCRLKSLADLYVSPHRSEGFGLNIMESILLGVPVLCSDYAGGTDLLANAEPRPIPVKLREIGRAMGPYAADAIWCEPDIDRMEARLLAFFDGEFSKTRFRGVRKDLRAALSAAAVGKKLKGELELWCGLNAERAVDRLEAFRPLVSRPHDECFNLSCVDEATRRSADAPGLDRLGEIAMATVQPQFSIITPTFNSDPQWLHELYDDLLHQSFPSWEWCICDDGSSRPDTLAALDSLRRKDVRIKVLFTGVNRGIAAATNAAVSFALGRYIVMIDHDDRVSGDLLAAYHEAVRGQTGGTILYCDEDKIDVAGRRCETYFKPDWSPQHLLSCMYVLHCLCIRKSVFLELGGYRPAYDGAQDHDFLLRAASAGVPVVHVDRLMYHWRMGPSSAAGGSKDKNYAIEVGRRAVSNHLAQRGIAGEVEHGLIPGTYRVRPTIDPGRVALNILTCCTPVKAPLAPRGFGQIAAPANDASSNGTYVEHFVRSILANAPALDFEIRVIVDRHAEHAAEPLRDIDPRVTIVPFDRSGEQFNFAEKSNFAVRSSAADRVVLLNDDMEAMDAEWLPALLEMLQLPDVGVVGGRLLYADDTVQHCGMALGVLGPAAHLFHGFSDDSIAYNAFNAVIRNYSAVTAAMIAFRRTTFERAGGFDVEFPIDYNDVDFCLKAAEAGLRTVYTPFARLRHFESRSARRLVADSFDRHRFTQRWAAYIERDPFYNRNLPRDNATCSMTEDQDR